MMRGAFAVSVVPEDNQAPCSLDQLAPVLFGQLTEHGAAESRGPFRREFGLQLGFHAALGVKHRDQEFVAECIGDWYALAILQGYQVVDLVGFAATKHPEATVFGHHTGVQHGLQVNFIVAFGQEVEPVCFHGLLLQDFGERLEVLALVCLRPVIIRVRDHNMVTELFGRGCCTPEHMFAHQLDAQMLLVLVYQKGRELSGKMFLRFPTQGSQGHTLCVQVEVAELNMTF